MLDSALQDSRQHLWLYFPRCIVRRSSNLLMCLDWYCTTDVPSQAAPGELQVAVGDHGAPTRVSIRVVRHHGSIKASGWRPRANGHGMQRVSSRAISLPSHFGRPFRTGQSWAVRFVILTPLVTSNR